MRTVTVVGARSRAGSLVPPLLNDLANAVADTGNSASRRDKTSCSDSYRIFTNSGPL
ncbi:hypothetical protein [Kibdelosporangium philippinense]|uniref:hypothetical protein n=1 Tax=Kibdelosporangium philippinense TaxID=211113 RepID=UPI003616A5CA